MTRLLVSVRSAAEAQAALAGGADIIDVKEPLRGSLGRAEETVWREVVNVVAEKAAISVALGELSAEPLAVTLPGISFAKVGLQGCRNQPAWRERLVLVWQQLPQATRPVAVVYADWLTAHAPAPDEIVTFAAEHGVRHILVDTYSKTTGRLLDHWPLLDLRGFAHRVAAQNQHLVLAGSLDATDLPYLLPLHPWALALRGAVCHGGREGTLDEQLVRQWREMLPTSF